MCRVTAHSTNLGSVSVQGGVACCATKAGFVARLRTSAEGNKPHTHRQRLYWSYFSCLSREPSR